MLPCKINRFIRAQLLAECRQDDISLKIKLFSKPINIHPCFMQLLLLPEYMKRDRLVWWIVGTCQVLSTIDCSWYCSLLWLHALLVLKYLVGMRLGSKRDLVFGMSWKSSLFCFHHFKHRWSPRVYIWVYQFNTWKRIYL